MALLQPKAELRPRSEERRRFQRVRVDLLGRYMLADRREFPCQVVNMSPGGMAVIATHEKLDLRDAQLLNLGAP